MRILLVSAEPIPTTSRVQHNTLQLVSPTKNHHIDLLTIQPKTRNEINLLAALRESEARVQSLKNRVVERQATNILNEMYCDTLRRQLAHQEKKKSGLKGKGKLVGDGLPRLLSGDDFNEKVVEHTKWQEREEGEKAARRQAREDRTEALTAWKKREEERKQENDCKRQRYKDAVKAWEAAKVKARTEKQKFGQLKPKMEKLEGPIPKPPVYVHEEASSEDEEVSNGEDDET